MPGIFGLHSRQAVDERRGIARGMRRLLLHQPWYAGFLEDDGRACLGALSTSPHFRADGNFAARGDVRAAIDGFGLTVDDEPVPADEPALAARVIRLYERDGEDFVGRLGGSFNVALHDAARGRLLLCNDRFGFSHLYYHHDGDRLLFAPETKAFLAYPGLDATLDEGAVAYFFSAWGLAGDRTHLERVRMLPPGSILGFEDGKLSLRRYWKPVFAPERDTPRRRFMEE